MAIRWRRHSTGASQRVCTGTPFLGHLVSFLQPGPLNLALSCEVTGGASGGGWTIHGNVLNGVTDYGYGDDPDTDFGSYFGGAVRELYEQASRGGKVTPTSIQASFADRGGISVRFRPAGRKIRATRDAGCGKPSDRLIGQFGLFVGALRFRGEGGYTSARVHRVHGGSIDFGALIACLLGGRPGQHALLPAPRPPLRLPPFGTAAHLHGSGPGAPGVRTHPSHRSKRTTLIADRKLPLARTVFGAQLRGEGRARFLALGTSSEGSIGIIRLAIASGPRSAFAFDDRLAGATVAPPAPFSGNGALQHGPGSEKSWTGSLAVSFLGAPRVPLTGSPFKTLLAQSW